MKKNIIGLLAIMMLLTGCSRATENAPQSQPQSQQEAYVLEFEAVTTEGEAMTSACFADSKLTMLNVWATYCSPCLEEMPALGEIAASYDEAEFQMMGIVSDVMEGGDTELLEEARDLIARTEADYPHLLANESLYTNLLGSVSAVPTTFFVNQKGEVLGYLVGAYTKEDWEAMINELLATVE